MNLVDVFNFFLFWNFPKLKFKPTKTIKIEVFKIKELPKLILCKIWVAEKF